MAAVRGTTVRQFLLIVPAIPIEFAGNARISATCSEIGVTLVARLRHEATSPKVRKLTLPNPRPELLICVVLVDDVYRVSFSGPDFESERQISPRDSAVRLPLQCATYRVRLTFCDMQ